MKYGGFTYENLNNIGDYIQSLGAEQFLPAIDIRVNRDSISNYSGNEPLLLVMNGWFSHTPNLCFPPSNQIKALYWGFHVTNWNNSWQEILKSESLEYLKKHEPIGCRDRKTMEHLKKNGINSFFSKCLTLTFPRRTSEPRNGVTLLVDAQHLPIPEKIRKEAVIISHKVNPLLTEKMKFDYAQYLLNLYRHHAKLVVTTRLHCALPCVAMGIPVVFFGDESDYRISILKDVGLKINRIAFRSKAPIFSIIGRETYLNPICFPQTVNWNPKPVEFELQKSEMILTFTRLLKNKISQLS